MAKEPIIFAMANPDPEIWPPDATDGASRCDHRDRPLGLPEPGQQRPRLPLHLPRRARRARDRDQRRDEDRRCRGPRRTGARAGAGGSRGGVWRPLAELRARLHHPGAVRSAADGGGRLGGGRSGGAERRRAEADREHGGVSAGASRAAQPDGFGDEPRLRECASRTPSGSCSPRARSRTCCAPRSPSRRRDTELRCWSAAKRSTTCSRKWASRIPGNMRSSTAATRRLSAAPSIISTRSTSATACSAERSSGWSTRTATISPRRCFRSARRTR